MLTIIQPELVTASAGTGKTYWIIHHVRDLILQGVPIDRIGIITFTEAAASELRTRVAGVLRENGHPDADRVGGAPISTIHGFALSLIRRHALTLGMSASFDTLGEASAGALRRLCLNEALEDPANRDRVFLLKEAMGAWDPNKVNSLIFTLLEKAYSLRIDPAGLLYQEGENQRRIEEAFGKPGDPSVLDAELGEALTIIIPLLPMNADFKKDEDPLKRAREAFAVWPKDPFRAAELAAKLPDGSKKLEPLIAPLREKAAQWVRHHPKKLTHLVELSEAAYALATDAMERYAAGKSARDCLDFNDQISLALQLLEKKGMAERVAAEFPHLLVDEFQDTSPLQFRLIETLREHGTKTYYVGDLKQAIYGWRDADSRLMGALLDTAEKEPKTLGQNWRSREELINFNNDLFAPCFEKSGLPFDQVKAALPFPPAESPSVELVIKGKSYPGPETFLPRLLELMESLQVLDRDTKVMRPLKFSDIAILERGNDALEKWSEAFRTAGIPFARESAGWSARIEVREALAWLRTLANPYDTQAMADALCSSLFGIAPSSLAPLAVAGLFRNPGKFLESSEAWEELAYLLSDPEKRLFRRFRSAWLEARKNPLPLSSLIKGALESVEAERRTMVFPDGLQRRANLVRLIELASEMEESSQDALALQGLTGPTLESFLLRVLAMAETDEDRQPLTAKGDAVQLVTMHRAKGLEFPVVVIPRLSTPVGADPYRSEVRWPSDANAFLGPDLFRSASLAFVPPHPDLGDLRERLGQTEADALRAHEELCLLYVAFTRARDYLLVGWMEKARKGSLQELLGVELIGDRLDGHTVRVTNNVPMAQFASPLFTPPKDLLDALVSGKATEAVPELWSMPDALPIIQKEKPLLQWKSVPLKGRITIPPGVDGIEFGEAVHTALRLADFQGNNEPLFTRMKQRWEVPIVTCAREAVEIVRILLQDLGVREVLREVPFLLKDELPVTGRIDLLVSTPEGWMVLDFKTEWRLPKDLVERYGDQLLRYGKASEAQLGEKPKLGLIGLALGQLLDFGTGKRCIDAVFKA